MLNAIQQGIFTKSTKVTLEELEQQKSDLSVRIMQEEMVKPPIDKDKIVFWLTRYANLIQLIWSTGNDLLTASLTQYTYSTTG